MQRANINTFHFPFCHDRTVLVPLTRFNDHIVLVPPQRCNQFKFRAMFVFLLHEIEHCQSSPYELMNAPSRRSARQEAESKSKKSYFWPKTWRATHIGNAWLDLLPPRKAPERQNQIVCTLNSHGPPNKLNSFEATELNPEITSE